MILVTYRVYFRSTIPVLIPVAATIYTYYNLPITGYARYYVELLPYDALFTSY